MNRFTKFLAATSVVTIALAAPAFAEDASCKSVTFSDVGWTDITATTAATTEVLKALGYETDIKVLSVPVTYQALAKGDVDIFLGNWMPTMEGDIKKYREEGSSRPSAKTLKARNIRSPSTRPLPIWVSRPSPISRQERCT